MANEDRFGRYANIPIPSYDEAISSRPGSSTHQQRGAGEISDDAERQGLLGQDGPPAQYHSPTVESERSSVDSDLRLPEVGGSNDEARRHVEELDYLDPTDLSRRSPRPYHRARLRNISSRFSKISATLSSIRLPSLRSFYAPVSTTTSDEPISTPPVRTSLFTRLRERIPPIPEEYRLSAPTAARLVGLATLFILFYILFTMDVFSGARRVTGRFDPESVRAFVQENVDSERIAEYLTHITSYDHVAGTEGDLYMAEWMREHWAREGPFDDIALLSYYVYLNYPTTDGRSVSIVSPEEQRWVATLEEDIINPDRQQTLAWHGLSKSGEVEGHLIYANGGNSADFAFLAQQGIVLNGSIALVREYGSQEDRSIKVKAAEEAGCAGILLYSDPSDDGAGRGEVWPEGPWRTEDSLQRGSVAKSSWVVGDPLTPGYASTPDAKPVSKEGNPGLPSIPSLPLAWRDAKALLSSLKSHGVWVPEDWVGGTEDFDKRWFSGNAPTTQDPSPPIVHLKNLNDENEKQQIWNLHGILKGVESDKKIIVGNHRDSWCFGSVDPGSGSAVMMELVAIFGELRNVGWRPLRTIEFASWDAEEYNMVGSTEYVEDNIDYLRDNGIAYLNVDVGVYGPEAIFRAAASPVWQRPLLHALGRVSDPNSDKSLRDTWEARNTLLEGLGAGSDYVAFQDMAGISSIDFGFEGAKHGFPYHSCYETFEWMNKFGDPSFNYHRALAQVWALLILDLSDHPLLPLDLRTYAAAIKETYLKELSDYADALRQKSSLPDAQTQLDLTPLRTVSDAFVDRAAEFQSFEDRWTTSVYGSGGVEGHEFGKQRLEFNDALSNFERDLLDLPTGPDDKDQHGVPGREQFKHIIFGPSTSDGYAVGYFPLVRDALTAGNWTQAQKMVEKSAAILQRAVDNLPDLG